MSESFAELLEESLQSIEMSPGSIVTGTIVDIDDDWVVVHAGLKSEGVIPKDQFLNETGEFDLSVGDQIKVAMEVIDDGWGETRLSREKAKRAESWQKLENAIENNEIVNGIISGKVKGGFTVDIEEVRAFLPGSLVDVRPLRDTIHLEGKPLEFKVIKIDQKRNNVVVSRRAVLEDENSQERGDDRVHHSGHDEGELAEEAHRAQDPGEAQEAQEAQDLRLPKLPVLARETREAKTGKKVTPRKPESLWEGRNDACEQENRRISCARRLPFEKFWEIQWNSTYTN